MGKSTINGNFQQLQYVKLPEGNPQFVFPTPLSCDDSKPLFEIKHSKASHMNEYSHRRVDRIWTFQETHEHGNPLKKHIRLFQDQYIYILSGWFWLRLLVSTCKYCYNEVISYCNIPKLAKF